MSGGEPLLQAAFVREVFELCHREGIHTCLDTSGSLLTDEVKALLDETDRVLLDIKYTDEARYTAHVGCGMTAPLAFLDYLNARAIPTTVRQVTIPTVNDTEADVQALKEIVAARPCVDKVELLPFRKICQVKYDNLGIPFPFGDLPEPTPDRMQMLKNLL